MPSKAKRKSYGHESSVARALSVWWDSTFKRNPSSGALRWNGQGWEYGDLLPPEDFPGIVECKSRKSIDLDMHLRPIKIGVHHPASWWQQVQSDTLRCYKETQFALQPMLIYKANALGNRIVIERDLFVALGSLFRGIPFLGVAHPEAPPPHVILCLEAFLGRVGKTAFIEAANKVIPMRLLEVV